MSSPLSLAACFAVTRRPAASHEGPASQLQEAACAHFEHTRGECSTLIERCNDDDDDGDDSLNGISFESMLLMVPELGSAAPAGVRYTNLEAITRYVTAREQERDTLGGSAAAGGKHNGSNQRFAAPASLWPSSNSAAPPDCRDVISDAAASESSSRGVKRPFPWAAAEGGSDAGEGGLQEGSRDNNAPGGGGRGQAGAPQHGAGGGGFMRPPGSGSNSFPGGPAGGAAGAGARAGGPSETRRWNGNLASSSGVPGGSGMPGGNGGAGGGISTGAPRSSLPPFGSLGPSGHAGADNGAAAEINDDDEDALDQQLQHQASSSLPPWQKEAPGGFRTGREVAVLQGNRRFGSGGGGGGCGGDGGSGSRGAGSGGASNWAQSGGGGGDAPSGNNNYGGPGAAAGTGVGPKPRRAGQGLQGRLVAPSGLNAPYKNPLAARSAGGGPGQNRGIGAGGGGGGAAGQRPAGWAASAAAAGGMPPGVARPGGRTSLLDEYPEGELPDCLKGLDPKLIEDIELNIMDAGAPVTFDDIAGLTAAKAAMFEAVVLPKVNPNMFNSGLTRSSRGVLLFGPPGTGKTLIGKAVAHECGATFFSISASSITSKWIGESEKLVKALFAVASLRQPSIVFIDEIDSLLTSRSDGEHESSRRVKTEFLVQIDGARSAADSFVVVIGATNRPQELDEAARRRFTKRVYVPLPDAESRRALVTTALRGENSFVPPADLETIVRLSEGYSGADLAQVCTEAAWGVKRQGVSRALSTLGRDLASIEASDFAPLSLEHFQDAFRCFRPTVAPTELAACEKWNDEFGTRLHPDSLAVMDITRKQLREAKELARAASAGAAVT